MSDNSKFWIYMHSGNSIDAANKIDRWMEAYAAGEMRRKYAIKEMTIWLKHEPLVVSVLCGETAWHIDGETLVIHSTKEQREALGKSLEK